MSIPMASAQQIHFPVDCHLPDQRHSLAQRQSASFDGQWHIQGAMDTHLSPVHGIYNDERMMPFTSSASTGSLQGGSVYESRPADHSSVCFPHPVSSIGPSRTRTRGQRLRAATIDITPGRHIAQSMSSPLERNYDNQQALASRVQPIITSMEEFRDREGLSIALPGSGSVQHPYSSSPDSPGHFNSPFDYYSSQMTPILPTTADIDRRSISPSTSLSSQSGSSAPLKQETQQPYTQYHLPQQAPPRTKHRKQRLYNVDRRDICMYAEENPNIRQEDIALRYNVERSTISKILKHRKKWLQIPAEEELKVAKHRPSKFPEIERKMADWLMENNYAEPRQKIALTDSAIRSRAKAIAVDMGLDDSKFKASPGWVDNFKHRHGIRGGIWTGLEKSIAQAQTSVNELPEHQRIATSAGIRGPVIEWHADASDSQIEPTASPSPISAHLSDHTPSPIEGSTSENLYNASQAGSDRAWSPISTGQDTVPSASEAQLMLTQLHSFYKHQTGYQISTGEQRSTISDMRDHLYELLAAGTIR